MQVESKLTEKLQQALSKDVLKRFPLTFLPFINQQLHQWDYLFPNERKSTERLLLYVAQLSPEQSEALFREVNELEEKMGVRQWQFSTAEQTIQNSSQLSGSRYFQEWRRSVQAVFDAGDNYSLKTNEPAKKPGNRLILLDLPRALPVDAANVWRRWQGLGRPVKLDLASSGASGSAFESLLAGKGTAGEHSLSLLDTALNRKETSDADIWLVDAGRSLIDPFVDRQSGANESKAVLLSYTRLEVYRQNFSHEMNTMRKDLADADAVFDRLRKVEVTPWCPTEVASHPAVREFVRALYLTGNGAVIFGNSFVEWAASEAFRRARPSFLAARFSMRSKPKPFTGVAVFDNPEQVNPLPPVDDPAGSAVDAQMLALYVWLAANRYEEYQHSVVCVCVAESLSEAYVVAPPEFARWQGPEPVPLDRFGEALRAWIT